MVFLFQDKKQEDKIMKLLAKNIGTKKLVAGAALVVGIVFAASSNGSGESGEYQFPRTAGLTAGGYPLPLTGEVLTRDHIVVKDKGAELRSYPEIYIPGTEPLGEDEMRIVAIGSGNPAIRIGQAATGWAVELGNGDKFVFDIGGGTVGNLWSLGSSPAEFDKLFISHLHLDHVGGIFGMFDAMGWSRNIPLQVWGSSGATKENGTAAFVENVQKASSWHIESKTGIAPSEGMTMVAHEFDYDEFTEDSPNQLIYDVDGVKIYAYPVLHTIVGSVGYRLEWNDLSMSFSGDTEPSTLVAQQSEGVDVFIHESFISAEAFAAKNNVSMEIAENVVDGAHTTPDTLGQLFDIAQPALGVATHYSLDDDLVDPFFEEIATTYNGPVAVAQDMMVINVTPEQIVTRMTMPNMLSWAEPAPELETEPVIGELSDQTRPDWITETRIQREEI